MEYRFVLGIGRSGTTFLSRLLTLTSAPIKSVVEPLPKLKGQKRKRRRDPSFCTLGHRDKIQYFTDVIRNLAHSNDALTHPERRVERTDPGFRILLLKEVHALLAFPAILKALQGRAIVVTRDTARVLDSYFQGHTRKKRTYLVQEYDYMCRYCRRGRQKYELYDETLSQLPKKLVRYFTRPRIFTSEFDRQVCITECVRVFLTTWAQQDPNVHHVTFESLCSEPITNARQIYEFLGFTFDPDIVKDIEAMTTGKETGYYSTTKNSRQVLMQNYRYLTPTLQQRANRLIER